MIAGGGADAVKQVTLGVVNVLQVGLAGNSLNSFLERNHLIGASRHRRHPDFQSLGKMHRTDGQSSNRRFNILGENLKAGRGTVCRSFGKVQLSRAE
jgi:hypothetical protein